MKGTLKWTYKTLRSVVVTALVAIVAIFALAYALLMLPSVQQKIKHEGEKALSEYLKTDVSIDYIDIRPFNQLALHGVKIPDQQGDSLITIDKLAAGVSLKKLIAERRLVLTFGEIVGLNAHITRATPDSPTNAQFLIDALKGEQGKPPSKFDVEVKNVVLRKSNIAYDVLSEPRKSPERLDPNHLALNNINADVEMPHLRNNDFAVNLKRLSAEEQSGLKVKRLSANVLVTDSLLRAENVELNLPGSHIHPDDITLNYASLKTLGEELKQMPLEVSLRDNVVTPSDFAALEPALSAYPRPIDLTATIRRDGNAIAVSDLHLNSFGGRIAVDGSAYIPDYHNPKTLTFDVPRAHVNATAGEIAKILEKVPGASPQAKSMLARCGDVGIDGNLSGSINSMQMDARVTTAWGQATLNGDYRQGDDKQLYFNGHVASPGFDLARLLARSDLGSVALDADIDGTLKGNDVAGTLKGNIDHVDFRGTRYHDITADVAKTGNDITGTIAMNDEHGQIHIDGQLNSQLSTLNTHIHANRVNLNRLGLWDKYPDRAITADIDANLTGSNLDDLAGEVDIRNFTFADAKGGGVTLENVHLTAENEGAERRVTLNSDYLNGEIYGTCDTKTLVPTVKRMLSGAFPQFFGDYANYYHSGAKPNDLTFNFEIQPNEAINRLVNLPVDIVYRTTLKGRLSESDNNFYATLDAPYLLNGKKIIEKTHLTASLDSATHHLLVNGTTNMPIKDSRADVAIALAGADNHILADVGWRVARAHDYHGNLKFDALLAKSDDGGVRMSADVLPSQLVFNDTAWTVQPGHIDFSHQILTVDNLAGEHGKQFVRINGKASKNPADELVVDLNDVELDEIFAALDINHLTFGGQATGTIAARDLFNGTPQVSTEAFFVRDFKYNDAPMGDADMTCRWDNDQKAVCIAADLTQENDCHTLVDGAIFVTRDSLRFDFNAQRANVAVMKPYMSAFTSDINGEMSGWARLYGNFSDINLIGDVCCDTLNFHLDFTNVTYHVAGDSVHLRPNYIYFNDVVAHDRNGNTGMFNGWVRHESFHNPSFEFSVTDANNLLAYDTNEKMNPVWYGTIYGNGSAFVGGVPGMVRINVNMQSAPGSSFTFVISDTEEAGEYDFITFRDRDTKDRPVVVEAVPEDTIPEIVRQLTQKATQAQNASPTNYVIDLQGDITNDLNLIVVMDPQGGDKIRAKGKGTLRMTYDNIDEALGMYGKYTLEKGSYNFTLQDVIIKDFTIREGSSISFQGDPYDATLDINATYRLTANLKDLDESFANDQEITRTNVPVLAVLKANGPLSAPEIGFDLEFPSLTSDAYRKVHSIISTDDIMNREIIYLLALNRFYTPDYMASTTTNNNELTSVASSTISSQLSRLLGNMTDLFSIAPNFRSDKGDFSDMEVDLMLSSQLFDNRLIINGNLGYRDNTYNTHNSNFIGDFDIEYLLNRQGTLRLKAYNHFNDQNYYVRNALTTQGLGIMWKRDFDNLFKRKSVRSEELGVRSDSTLVRRDSTSNKSSLQIPIQHKNNQQNKKDTTNNAFVTFRPRQ